MQEGLILDRYIAEGLGLEKADLLFFFGHDNGVSEDCFSQWYKAPFMSKDHKFPTAEHYMMARKAALFGDTRSLEKILCANSPEEARRLGRGVRDFDQKIWDDNKVGIVTKGNRLKFAAHPDLAFYLLRTSKFVLVEANPNDKVWGIGLGANDPRAFDPKTWEGENLLGFILMDLRDKLFLRK